MVPVKKVNRNKKRALLVNLNGTKNIIDSLNKYSNKKVWLFYSSTSHVYSFGNRIKVESRDTIPLNYYGKTKSRNTKGGVVYGKKNSFKKAIVELIEGNSIDFYSNI